MQSWIRATQSDVMTFILQHTCMMYGYKGLQAFRNSASSSLQQLHGLRYLGQGLRHFGTRNYDIIYMYLCTFMLTHSRDSITSGGFTPGQSFWCNWSSSDQHVNIYLNSFMLRPGQSSKRLTRLCVHICPFPVHAWLFIPCMQYRKVYIICSKKVGWEPNWETDYVLLIIQ